MEGALLDAKLDADRIGVVHVGNAFGELFTGQAHLHDMVERHMGPPLPVIGGGQPVSEAVALLEKSDAALVLIDGKPRGILTRQDLLAHLGAR